MPANQPIGLCRLDAERAWTRFGLNVHGASQGKGAGFDATDVEAG